METVSYVKDKFAETKAKTMNEISLSLLKYAAINDDHADYTTAKEMKKAKTSNKHRAPWLGNDERSVFFFFFFIRRNGKNRFTLCLCR